MQATSQGDWPPPFPTSLEFAIYHSKRIAAVIPAHNEQAHIDAVIAGLPDWVDDIIVVDDASTDDTVNVAAKSLRRPTVLTHPSNTGVGGAVIDGYLEAISLGAQVIVRLDGDGQMDPADMTALVDPVALGKVGFAKGNRFKLGRIPELMPASRSFGNIALTFMTKLASGYWHLFDPQNGYSAISAEVINSLDLEYLRRCGYFFENGLLIELNAAEVPAVDVPTATRYGDEVSGIRISRVLATFPPLLLRGMFRRIHHRYVIRDFSPVVVFLGFGAALFLVGATLGAYQWIKTATTGMPTPLGSIMLAALPIITGFELLLQGLVLDINGSPR